MMRINHKIGSYKKVYAMVRNEKMFFLIKIPVTIVDVSNSFHKLSIFRGNVVSSESL